MEDEVWKEVPSFPEMLASSWGRVKVKDVTRTMPNGGTRVYSGSPTYGYEDKSATGREGVPKRRVVRIGRYKKTFRVHRLVCEAFHGSSPKKNMIVMHLNENPSDNRPSNLQWATQKENLNMPLVKEYHKKMCRTKMKGDENES